MASNFCGIISIIILIPMDNGRNKRILVLTAQKGGGHRSSSDAIEKAIMGSSPDTEICSFDALELYPGYTGDEKGYISFTTRFRVLWKLFFEFTSLFSGMSNFILYKVIYKRFKELADRENPDIILSVHPCFVGCVHKCLKKMRLDVPVCVCIVDLVKHSRLWHDKKSALTFVPTSAMYDLLLKKGFQKDRVVHSGFPTKDNFDSELKIRKTEISTPNVLMVNPSLKRGKVVLGFISAALKHDVDLIVVTGNNKKLKNYLEKRLLNAQNVTVLDYVFDMDKKMASADVLITKAGPNILMEAVKMRVPVLITGHILGQEEKNYQYITENGYGFRCKSPKELGDALTRLFANRCELLKEISRNEQACNDTSGAGIIAEKLLGFRGF